MFNEYDSSRERTERTVLSDLDREYESFFRQFGARTTAARSSRDRDTATGADVATRLDFGQTRAPSGASATRTRRKHGLDQHDDHDFGLAPPRKLLRAEQQELHAGRQISSAEGNRFFLSSLNFGEVHRGQNPNSLPERSSFATSAQVTRAENLYPDQREGTELGMGSRI